MCDIMNESCSRKSAGIEVNCNARSRKSIGT
mgnify:FL=1